MKNSFKNHSTLEQSVPQSSGAIQWNVTICCVACIP